MTEAVAANEFGAKEQGELLTNLMDQYGDHSSLDSDAVRGIGIGISERDNKSLVVHISLKDAEPNADTDKVMSGFPKTVVLSGGGRTIEVPVEPLFVPKRAQDHVPGYTAKEEKRRDGNGGTLPGFN